MEDNFKPSFKFRLKKFFSRNLSWFQSIIIVFILLFLAYNLILHNYSQFLVEKILSEEEIFELDKKIQLMQAKEKLALMVDYKPASPRFVNTFGDSFTSLSHIDRQKTDMYWDGQVGAFLFPPEISLEKLEECVDKPCGLGIQDEKWQSFCNSQGCLERIDNTLIYGSLPLALPSEIDNGDLLSLDISALGSDFYLGAILKTEDEKVSKLSVYRFDGQNYFSILKDKTVSSERRLGRIALGGNPDDYFLAYTGYYGSLWRIKDGEVIDISQFFPLRVTTRDFYPQIYHSSYSRSFYLCNSSPGNPALIKFWYDQEGEMIGSADLRQLLFDTAARRLICDFGEKNSDLNVHALISGIWQKWSLTDNGFAQDRIRQVISRNLNKREFPVKAAFASAYTVSPDVDIEAYQLFFSNNQADYSPALFNKWLLFDSPGEEFYWRMIFKSSQDKYYSPWLSDFRTLHFETIEE